MKNKKKFGEIYCWDFVYFGIAAGILRSITELFSGLIPLLIWFFFSFVMYIGMIVWLLMIPYFAYKSFKKKDKWRYFLITSALLYAYGCIGMLIAPLETIAYTICSIVGVGFLVISLLLSLTYYFLKYRGYLSASRQ